MKHMFDNDILDNRVSKRRRLINDLILLAACLLGAVLILLILHMTGNSGSTVSVIYDSETIYSQSLYLDGYLIITNDGTVPKVDHSTEYDQAVIDEAVLAGYTVNIVKIADGQQRIIRAAGGPDADA